MKRFKRILHTIGLIGYATRQVLLAGIVIHGMFIGQPEAHQAMAVAAAVPIIAALANLRGIEK